MMKIRISVPKIYAMSGLPDPTPNPALDRGTVGLREHCRPRQGDLAVGLDGNLRRAEAARRVCSES
jgi:hypothetical protein